jgi:hypothetical protein
MGWDCGEVGDVQRELNEVALELVTEEKDSLLLDLIDGVIGLLLPELMLDLGGGGEVGMVKVAPGYIE